MTILSLFLHFSGWILELLRQSGIFLNFFFHFILSRCALNSISVELYFSVMLFCTNVTFGLISVHYVCLNSVEKLIETNLGRITKDCTL